MKQWCALCVFLCPYGSIPSCVTTYWGVETEIPHEISLKFDILVTYITGFFSILWQAEWQYRRRAPCYLLTVVPGININTSIGTCQQPVTSAWTISLSNLSPNGTLYQRRASQRILLPHSSHACAAPHSAALRYPPIGAILLRGLPIIEPEPEGRELRSGVKCIVVTIVTGSLWLVRRYRWGQVNFKTISTIPSH